MGIHRKVTFFFVFLPRKTTSDMNNREIPVLLLTGYLGSGKTTLVNKILSNRKGIRFAVIVNDLGEVNIDADLIQKDGVVARQDESLVALQNGCICCTLKADLIEQIFELLKMQRFDYIVIEASGICEPEPIARTICSIPSFGGAYVKYGICRLDCIATVVDALRMRDEFGCGDSLGRKDIDEDDIENLIIQQIEFCNVIILNKASEVSPEELGKIRKIISTLQPSAEIMECDYAGVELDKILNTGMFDFDKASLSAGWIRGIESTPSEEAEEYGISTFVYYRRPAFDINKFDYFVGKKWPKSVIRAKGICYFGDEPDMSYLFEQAGSQKTLKQAGQWYATAPEEDLEQLRQSDPGFMRDWDDEYGDRMQKIVFIGQDMDKEAIIRDLDDCLQDLR